MSSEADNAGRSAGGDLLREKLPDAGALERWLHTVDRAMEWMGDRLNPILIKETRQALKSRQFLITFALLLGCGWIWSILGVALMGEAASHGTQGDDMFFGYYIILTFPLLVIVPFGAFRSLATEQEDRTYELMSITTLDPRQIIRGKLGSAVVQMVVYLSAISPCLAFTYLLRGIDFLTILFILGYTILGSLALAMIALFIGTLTSEKHWQVVLSVLLVGALIFALYLGNALTGMLLYHGSRGMFTDWEFWMACGAFLTGFVGYFAMIFYAAAARITFASGNRSTRLRITMLAHQILFTGWMSWAWLSPIDRHHPEVILTFLICVGLHWYIMGALMTGESPELSSRVKRQLPQSHLGRAFFTWFNPGPGTGYVFAISNLAGALILALTAIWLGNVFDLFPADSWGVNDVDIILPFGVLMLCYVAIYLGIGLQLVKVFRKFTQAGILLSLLLQILLVLIGSGVPLIIQLMSPSLRYGGYSLLQISNPFWTLGHIADDVSSPEMPVLLGVLPLAALIVLLLNGRGIVQELRHVRIDKPRRVAEEDAQQAAVKHPVEPMKESPWD